MTPAAGPPPEVLVITGQYGVPWEPARGIFNQQQFGRLAATLALTVLVPVPWREALRHRAALRRAPVAAAPGAPRVVYAPFWYPPGLWRGAHAACLAASLLLHCPRLLLARRWTAVLGSWAYPDAVAAAWLARRRGLPVLMKVHGTDVNDYLAEPAKRRQILWAAGVCRAVVGVGRGLLQRLAQAGVPAERLHWVRHGVDAARFHPAPQAAARARLAPALGPLPPGAVLLLFVGRLHPVKDCAALVEAFAALAASRPHWHLALVGDGPLRAALQRQAEAAGVASRVHLAGRVDHAGLADWYAAADLVCLPSRSEGLPNVVLEALACGRPVVASAVGEVPALLPPFAGHTVPPGDAAALRQALARAVESAPPGGWDTARIAAHGRSFGWDEGVEALRRLLLDLAPAPAPTVSAAAPREALR